MKLNRISPLFLVTAIVCLFMACKKNDGSRGRHGMFVGTWKVTHIGADSNKNGIPEPDEWQPSGDSCYGIWFQFNDNGTGLHRFLQHCQYWDNGFNWSLQGNDQYLQVWDSTNSIYIYSLSDTVWVAMDTSSYYPYKTTFRCRKE